MRAMMICPTMQRQLKSGRRRPGIVMVAVIVTMTISLALFAAWARTIVWEHRRGAQQQFRLQAIRLAEAGIQRAMGQRAADTEYESESWSVPADELGGKYSAVVNIRITTPDNVTRFEAVAQYPAGAVRRAQITKRIEVPNASEDET
jgi:hypothetical protein